MDLKFPQQYSQGRRVNESPIMYVFDQFISPEECRGLIASAGDDMQRSSVCAGKGGVKHDCRTSTTQWVPHNTNHLTQTISDRVSRLVGLGLEHAEALQLIHYQTEQEYRAHHDAWDLNSEVGKRCTQRGGQRMLTCLIYLNKVEEGGGTGFPQLDLEVRSQEGRMLVFHNCLPGTDTLHPDTLHSGLPVLKGEKWAINLWFREKALRSIKPPAYKTTGFKRVIE